MSTASPVAAENRLLARLGPVEGNRLANKLEPVHLDRGRNLYRAGDTMGYAYFLGSGMCSLLSTAETGASTAAAMVGSAGMIGVPILLGVNRTPYQIIVQIRGDAIRLTASALRDEFNRCGQLHEMLLRYTYSLLAEVAQSAVCNRFHSVEKQLCRWLLVSRDRVKSDSLHLTHDMLSQMIGAPRPRLTKAAGRLQNSGLIDYRHGRIRILDREKLEREACGCYRIVREITDQ